MQRSLLCDGKNFVAGLEDSYLAFWKDSLDTSSSGGAAFHQR
jgi:hypothetical protein